MHIAAAIMHNIPGRPNPKPPALRKQGSSTAILEAALGDWKPIFSRNEMVKPATTGKYVGRPSIKHDVEQLDARLAENGEWNRGEFERLLELIRRIRNVVTTHLASGADKLEDMRNVYAICTDEIQTVYGNMAKIMQGEFSGDDFFDEEYGMYLIDERYNIVSLTLLVVVVYKFVVRCFINIIKT
jgi:hypothetical protein